MLFGMDTWMGAIILIALLFFGKYYWKYLKRKRNKEIIEEVK